MHQTNEEEKNLLKSIWQEYGKTFIVSIVVIAVVFFGYRSYQFYIQENKIKASVLYQNILDLTEDHQGSYDKLLDQKKLDNLKDLVQKLQKNHSNSLYSALASMLEANQYVLSNQIIEAEKEYQWIVDRAFEPEMDALARLRLSRIMYVQNNDKALKTIKILDQIKSIANDVDVNQLKGDIYVKLGDMKHARKFYQSALTSAKKESLELVSILEMKINDLPNVDSVK